MQEKNKMQTLEQQKKGVPDFLCLLKTKDIWEDFLLFYQRRNNRRKKNPTNWPPRQSG